MIVVMIGVIGLMSIAGGLAAPCCSAVVGSSGKERLKRRRELSGIETAFVAFGDVVVNLAEKN